jgi:hypothetical protein
MGKTLVRRTTYPSPLLTKELQKRNTFSPWAMYKIYAPLGNLIAALLLFAVLAIMAQLTTTTSSDIVIGILLGLDIVCGIWNGVWLAMAWGSGDEALSFSQRRFQVLGDYLRRNRVHHADETSRLKALKRAYPRYSVRVIRVRQSIELKAVQHTYEGKGPLLPWKTSNTKLLYDADRARWSSDAAAQWKISNPTVDKVMEAVGEAQLVVEELENKAYAEALTEHRLDVLAIALQPPPASARSRARLAIEEDELDNILNS